MRVGGIYYYSSSYFFFLFPFSVFPFCSGTDSSPFLGMSTLVLGIKEINKIIVENVVENGGDFWGAWWEFGEYWGKSPINTPKIPGFWLSGMCRTCPTRRKLWRKKRGKHKGPPARKKRYNRIISISYLSGVPFSGLFPLW